MDIVCHSATKYLGGHGAIISGIVVEKGGFNWFNGKFPAFEQFFEEHKRNIDNDLLSLTAFTRRLRMNYLTDFGSHLSPQSAFYLIQGVETLSLRMQRHVDNALTFLSNHPAVLEVSYPSLPGSPYYKLAQKYFPKGAGAILQCVLKVD